MKDEEYDIVVKEDDDFATLLKKWKDIACLKKELLLNEDKIKSRMRDFLLTKHWDNYIDPKSKINITLFKGQKEEFDKKQLRFLLSEQQYASAIKIVKYEKMLITTPEDREKINKILK